jgi:hypothetical protein
MVFGNEKVRFKLQILLRWRVQNFHLKCLIQGWSVGSNNACVNDCGCVDSARYSNGKKKGDGKNGNRYLAWAFVEAISLRNSKSAVSAVGLAIP